MQSALAPETALVRDDRLPMPSARGGVAVATVLLIDGRPLMRECLTLGMRAEWPAVRLAATGWDLLDTVAANEPVDLCLVSLGTGGTLERARAAFPLAALVVLSDDDAYANVAAAATQGARGFFSSAVDLAVLVQGIRLVLMGGTAMPIAVTPPPPARSREATPAGRSRFSAELFTPKELEVLRSLATGRQNKLIAHELAICETTVKVHLRHIFRKLGTTNRTHAALLAREMLEATED
jgi:DNA-binding NarL/FixJ family response regulator